MTRRRNYSALSWSVQERFPQKPRCRVFWGLRPFLAPQKTQKNPFANRHDITWNPTTADIGQQPVTVDVTSAGRLVTPQSFTLDVVPDTQPPTVVVHTSTQQVSIGTNFTVEVAASDNGRTSLRFLLHYSSSL